MNLKKLLVFSILIKFSIYPSNVLSENVNLDFPFFTLRNITLLGDSYLKNGFVGLTRELQVPSSSSGSVVYNYPVLFFDQEMLGYLAPEYLKYGTATEKTDLFSYGGVILELAYGRSLIERGQGAKGGEFGGLGVEEVLGRSVDRGGGCEKLRIKGDFGEGEMRRLLLIGLSSANPNSSERSSMSRVFQMLNYETNHMVVPKVKPCLV